MACNLLWRRTVWFSHRLCQWCVLSQLAVVPGHAHPQRWVRVFPNLSRQSMETVCSRNSGGWPSLADIHDTLHHCRQARTLCCCQSKPTSTTSLEYVSVRRFHPPSAAPPLVLETSLCDHWRPVLLPTGLDTAHPPLQTSLSLELQLAAPELECHNVHMMPELVHSLFAV